MAGGVTNIGAVSLDGVIAGVSVNLGANNINVDIMDYVAEAHGLQIGLLSADKLRNEIGTGEISTKVQDLTVNIDGKEEFVYNGLDPQTLNIKQTYEVADIGTGDKTLLDNKGKIRETWLPSSIVGAMNFIGTFDASKGQPVIDLREEETAGVKRDYKKGDYFIVSKEGNYDPEAQERTPDKEGTFFRVGDWAVYINTDLEDTDTTIDPEEKWIKIDNTDSVTTVNGQLGDVETYKGEYSVGKTYYKGDTVSISGKLYLVKNNFLSTDQAQDIANNLLIYGKVYTGNAPIKVDNNDDTISHNKSTVTNASYADVVLNSADATIDVKLLGYDEWGHINSAGIQKYKLGDFFQDSTRPIQVKGTELLKGEGNERKYPVNYTADEEWIAVSGTKGADNAEIKFSHKTISTSNITVEPDPSTNTTLYFGSTFKIPTITFDNAGHYSKQGSVEFTLSDKAIQHRHFNVTKVGNALTILAHEYTDDLEAGRFYNTSAPKMNKDTVDPNYLLGFKGSIEAYQFIQKGNEVLDESIEISSGYDYYDEVVNPNYDPNDPSKGPATLKKEIIGTYNKATNTITLGESGLFSGNEPRTYSAVAFNKQGIAVAGGYVLQFGGDTPTTNVPSSSLVIGGLFFRRITSLVSANSEPTPSLEEPAQA
jgi:hypothetical protein